MIELTSDQWQAGIVLLGAIVFAGIVLATIGNRSERAERK